MATEPASRDALDCAEREIRTTDGVSLLVRHYRCDEQQTRTVVISHGLSEHGDRYDHVSRFLVGRGWNVLVPDHRGHGRSGGVQTHIRRFARYADDLEGVINRWELPPASTVLLGHSMGGLVAVRHAQRFPGRVGGLVLTSPLLRVSVRIPPAIFLAGRVLSVIAPQTRFRSRIDPSFTTRDPEALARRLADPLIRRSVTARWFFAMRRSVRRAWAQADRTLPPLLVVQAGDDRIVDPLAAPQWTAAAASADKTYIELPGRYHEVLNESDWPQTAALVADWLDARFPSSETNPLESDADRSERLSRAA